MKGVPRVTGAVPVAGVNRNRLLLFAALAVVVLTLGVAAVRNTESNDPIARAQRLERQIACPICNGESVAESNSSEAVARRVDIEKRVKAGESDDTILGFYATTSGRLMLNPSDSGVGFIAWGIPVVAFVIAGAGLGFAIRRWRSETRMVASIEDEVLVARARKDVM